MKKSSKRKKTNKEKVGFCTRWCIDLESGVKYLIDIYTGRVLKEVKTKVNYYE